MSTLALRAARPAAPFVELTVAAAVLLALALLWAGAETRTIDGVAVWLKPAKFSLSFVIHFATLALILRAMAPGAADRRSVRLAEAVMATAFLAEMAYLFVQAARGEASHFNVSTPMHTALYQLMGVGAVLLVTMPLLVARAAAQDGTLGRGLRAGIVWGTGLSFGLTLIVAGYMSSQSGHHVGVASDAARALPLLGWSGEVGDLRPAHFLSLHAFQALPLLGLWLDRRGMDARLMRGAALLWAVLTLAVFAQALLGLPLIRL